MKRDLKFSIATLVCMIPLMFCNVWFLKEIWNGALVGIFTMLPILSYKNVLIIYFIKSLFGLDFKHSGSYYIDEMINKKRSSAEITFYTLIGKSLMYPLTYLIIFKIVI